MLDTLRIENLALLRETQLEFENGYSAVTGETGAGKSVLLGALLLLSGSRADKTLIREGADTCLMEAVFCLADSARLNTLLASMELPPCEDNQLLIRRTVSRKRASRITVNGSMATLAQLQEIGKEWIDFHGPGEPQKLFHEAEQLDLLDLYAGLRESVDTYSGRFREWRDQLEAMDKVRHEARLSPEEAEFLKTQIEEIDRLSPSEERIEELEQDYRRISSAQELQDLCGKLDDLFLGSGGICQRLQNALPQARKLSDLDPASASLADRVESLLIEAGDLSGEWKALAFEADFNSAKVKQVENDMDTWMRLKRRYGATVEGVLEKRAQMARRLEIQGDLDGTLGRMEAEADELKSQLRKTAAELRSKRLQAAHKLAGKAEALLQQLGFKKPKLGIEIVARKELGPRGDCTCQMTFCPNPGSSMLPLRKIASSGEMARVMLALKSVLAEVDATPVLVFDEVDSNIGGEVASAVARLLGSLGKEHQVFCITHLPQVAAIADNHYVVTKEQSDEATSVTIECLNGRVEQRVDEFACMLGDRSSASARKHARQLLGLED